MVVTRGPYMKRPFFTASTVTLELPVIQSQLVIPYVDDCQLEHAREHVFVSAL